MNNTQKKNVRHDFYEIFFNKIFREISFTKFFRENDNFFFFADQTGIF